MKTYKKKTIGLVIILWTCVYAQSAYDAIHIMDREMGFGTRALAMGGAYAAVADDYTAIYWNPAGLGQIEEAGIFTELSHLNFSNEALFSNQLTNDSQTYTRFRSFGFVFPIPTKRGSLVFALGHNRIVNFDDNLVFSGFSGQKNGIGFDITDENESSFYYPFDSNVYRSEQVSSEGGLSQWSLGGAISLSPRFILGVTAAYLSGKEQYRFSFLQKDSENNYNQYPADFDQYKISQVLQSDYGSLNLKIGGLIKLIKGLSIGGVMTLPSSFYIWELHSSEDELIFDDGYVDATEETGRWNYKVTTPFYFDGGLSFRLSIITLSASARYRDWSQTRFVLNRNHIGNADYREFLEENDQIRLFYQPTMEYHLGGEISVPWIRTKIRGGYALYPSPLIEATSSQDRQFFTGGLSFAIDKSIHLDITYLHGNWEREVHDIYTPSGTVEDITMQKVLFGFTYLF